MKIGFHHTGLMSSSAGKARIALFSLLAITAVSANTAHAVIDCTPSLYGTSYAGRNAEAAFNSINIATGAGTQIGLTGFNRISAMDVDPTSGILWAVAERPSAQPPPQQKVLIKIDRQTGVGTEIAELSFGNGSVDENFPGQEHIAGMSFDSSGTLYGFGSFDHGFYTIDVSAGTITTLGVIDLLRANGNALAFAPDDTTLYHVGDRFLNTVNLTTGATTTVGGLTFNVFLDPHAVSGMDYGPETGIYYAFVKYGQDGETLLEKINVTTLMVDHIGFTSDNMDGLVYICEHAPVITSDGGGATATVNAAENQTAVTTVTTVTATDADLPAQTLTFSISGGADQALFTIGGASGVLTFNSAPDFENPTDTGEDNDYDVQVTVTDDGAPTLTDVQDLTVSVTNVNDAPEITSDGGGATAALIVTHNQTAVTTVTATDTDLPAQTLTFSITGGADADLFGITDGVLTFNNAPDFDTPLDTGADNDYDVQVTVTDDGAPTLTDVQDIVVTVTNEIIDPIFEDGFE